MRLKDIYEQGLNVRLEVGAEDLVRFAHYIIENYRYNDNSNSSIQREYGGIDLAIEITGYSKSTIYNKVNKRQIPFKKSGTKLFFIRADLIEWLKTGTVSDDLKFKQKSINKRKL